ncbi:MAG: hypothetical protein ABII88_02240 [Candidatus Omnitrophota bacterium]
MAEFNYKQNRTRRTFKQEDSSPRHQEETDVPAMIKKMQQQLTFLERKIDILISQSSSSHSAKPFSRPFSRPSRPEGSSGHYGSRTRDDSSRERSFHKGKKPFPSKRTARS